MNKMNKEIYKKLSEDFPPEAMTVDNSRGFALTSIKAQYVRERLNEVMGVDGWSTHTDIIDRTDKGVAVRLQMTLHFPLENGTFKSITRTAFGGASVKDKGQTYGDLFKSAETDALSKAASNFGVGNNVFKGLVDAKSLGKTTTKTAPKTISKPKTANKNNSFAPQEDAGEDW